MIGFGRRKTRRGADKGSIVVQGARKSGGGRTKNRVMMTVAVFFGLYAAIGGRLVYFGLEDAPQARVPAGHPTASRPDLVDRNGEVLATDIKTASLYAEPRRIIDIDEAIENLATVIPDINYEKTYRKLDSDAGFVWLRRQLSPKQQAQIMSIGIPGLGFRTEKRRFYPGGPTASHILGLVNIDNKGIAGIEKYIDDQGLAVLQATGLATPGDLSPVKLSIDLRVQHIVRDELRRAMEKYKTIGAGAVVLDANTGEVLGMASLPDFDPNNPAHALDKDRLNRMSAGIYEMGSTFKIFTLAMGLDSGKFTMNSIVDASRPIRIGGYTIHDFHGKHRPLTIPEVFIYSSNIGAAKMAEAVGIPGQKAFLTKLGLLTRMDTELPEVAKPEQPKEWKLLNSITISFGHGVATTPLQTAVAGAAVVNGGKLIEPTFFPRSQATADAMAKQVISPETSAKMRYLFRLNVEKGSGHNAEVPGFYVGGKTGTAEKIVNGRYSNEKRFNAFLAAFPSDDPQYVVLVILDEPKPEKPGMYATAGMNAAPTVAGIIRRAAPLLGVRPDFGDGSKALLVSARQLMADD